MPAVDKRTLAVCKTKARMLADAMKIERYDLALDSAQELVSSLKELNSQPLLPGAEGKK